MKIVLGIEDKQGRSVVFVSDALEALSLGRAVELAKQNTLDGLHVVKKRGREYIRKKRNRKDVSAVESISVSSVAFLGAVDNLGAFLARAEVRVFWQVYQDSVRSRIKRGETPIVIEQKQLTTKEYVQDTLLPYRKHIFDAGRHFSIDPYIIGAIFIDEIARLAPGEEARDMIAALSIQWDVSVGIAQIKIETARGLIREGYYNPNTEDLDFSKEKINHTLRSHIYRYVSEAKHNVFFGAAKVKSDIDRWYPVLDIAARPEIIATLYSLPVHKTPPRLRPEASTRGSQIAEEFYPLAKEILGNI